MIRGVSKRLLWNQLVFGAPLLADYDPQANAAYLNLTIYQYEFLMGASGLLLGSFLIFGLIRALR